MSEAWAGARVNELSAGWGGRIRTCECRYQKPVPYHLATPQHRGPARAERAYSLGTRQWKGTILCLERGSATPTSLAMTSLIRDFHAHIYFNADELDDARALAAAAQARFALPVGHFHQRPVGPHPRGSCQLTIPPELFGDFAQWLALNRRGLTVFAHASTGDDRADHREHVIWFGSSEPLDLSIFD